MTRPLSAADRREQGVAVDWLVCFAVKEESAHFQVSAPMAASRDVIITGMGGRNAAQAIGGALELWQPRHVITAGFAGGLSPDLKCGTVIFDREEELYLAESLKALGALPATFHCANRIITTALEKGELRRQTRADAVEMESAIIRTACRKAVVPCSTVRVISDAAQEDLPLDFNALMSANDQINWWRFAREVAGRPTVIPRLLAFQRQTRTAARNLGRVLTGLVSQPLWCRDGYGVP